MSQVPEIKPRELHEALQSQRPPMILDVREPEELEMFKLPEVINIPVGELGQRFRELDPAQDWVVVCHSGARSAHATHFLKIQGFENVRNLAGGMMGYATVSRLH